MKDLAQSFEEHRVEDARAFSQINESVIEIKNTLTKIETNHLAHIEPDMANVKADMTWLKWITLAILAGVIGHYFK